MCVKAEKRAETEVKNTHRANVHKNGDKFALKFLSYVCVLALCDVTHGPAKQGQAIPLQGWTGFLEFEVPRISRIAESKG
jgi:hypothetical protein